MNRLTTDGGSAADPTTQNPSEAIPASAASDHGDQATQAPSRPRPDPTKRPKIVPKPRSKKINSAVLKVVRRTHLYTGLLLLPWVLIFGVSGFLFNHTTLLQSTPPETITSFSQDDLLKDIGFASVNANEVASQVIDQLNAQAGEGDPTFKLRGGASLSGLVTLSANGEKDGQNVRHTYTMNLNSGQAWVSTVPVVERERPQTTTPPFSGKQVALESLPVDNLATKVDDMTYEFGIDSDGNWATRGRGGGPEVRFVMQDDAGRDWNVTYNVLRGTLGGRASDEKPEMNFTQVMSRLHRLHHYPNEFGMRWLWILAADATALTMVFWGISGLIMWWQLKPTRTIGILAVAVMGIVGFVIVYGVLNDLTFSAPAVRGGAGGGPGIQQQQRQRQQQRQGPDAGLQTQLEVTPVVAMD